LSDISPDAELDVIGLFCPMPIARTKEEIENIEVGQVLKVEADDPAAEEDIARWAKRAGHLVLKIEKSGNIITFWIKRLK
jgi:tRNA 2-thiouridine synthesizing protein A